MGNLGEAIGWKSRCLILGIAACGFLSQAASADTTFSDGTFNPSDWPAIINFAGGGGAAGVSQQPSGGNPGSYYQITITANPGPSGTAAFFNNPAFTYTPSSQGAITSVTFSFDLENQRGGGSAFANLALEQNGHIYAGPEFDIVSMAWQHVGTTLVATDFGQVTSANGQFSLDLASNPNFSNAGSNIVFGFTNIFNTPADVNFTATEVMGIDNYNVLLRTTAAVPEPSTLGLIAFSGLALLRRRR